MSAKIKVERRGPRRNHVYVVMGLNQLWTVKRYGDGHVVAEGSTRGDTKAAAERLGYKFNV